MYLYLVNVFVVLDDGEEEDEAVCLGHAVDVRDARVVLQEKYVH